MAHTEQDLTQVTTDHDVIQQWTIERGGVPAAVEATSSEDDIGILRIDVPGYEGEDDLVEVEWDDWFDKFDDADLAFVYQEETARGERSNFNKLVDRSSVAERL